MAEERPNEPTKSAKKPFNNFEFSEVATLPDSLGLAGPLIGVDNNALIIAGGANFPDSVPWQGGKKKYYADIFVALRNSDGSFRWIDQTSGLPKAMGYGAIAQSSKGIVCLGGETSEGPIDDAFLLRFDSKSESVSVSSLPPIPEPTTGAMASVIRNTVYFLGGMTTPATPAETGFSGFSDKMFSLDLNNIQSGWKREPNLPSPFAFAVAVTQSDGETDCLYLFGGRAQRADEKTTRFFDTVYSFNPRSKCWRNETPIPIQLAAGTGAPLGISSVFLFGGDDGNFFNENEQRQAAIDQETDPVEKEKLISEKNRLIEEHQGFSRDIYLYDTITKTWTVPFRLPEGENPQVTTAAVVWGGAGRGAEILIPTGEIRPGVRTPKINLFRIGGQTHFTMIDYGVLTVYMLAMLGIGFAFMKREGTTNDFFLGGGRLPWWAVGISIFATTLSAITFLSMPAKAFATDWRMFPYNFGILLVAPIIIRCYLPYFRQLNLQTAYEYLELRFNRATRYFASGLFILFMISRTAIVLFLPSLALNVATGINVYFCIIVMALVTITYCTFGGMEAVVWSDVIQGGILVAGAVVSLVVLILWSDGGFVGFMQTGIESGKMQIFDFRFDLTQPVFWIVVLGSIANNIITYSSDQTLVQRYMCGTDEKQTVRSIWLNACLAIPVTLAFFLIGTALYTYYRTNPEWMDAGLRNADAIYPLFIINGLPPGVSGLVIAAIFAAAMSTLSSNINSASVAVYSDFLKFLIPDFSSRHPLGLSQSIGVVIGLLGMFLALFLATFDIKSLWDLFNTFLGMFTGPLGGLFLMGVFSRRINATGALIGLVASALVVGFVQFYLPVSFLLYGLIGMLSCYGIGFVSSVFIGGPAKTVVVLQKT